RGAVRRRRGAGSAGLRAVVVLRDLPAHAARRDVPEPRARLLQSAADPTTGRQSRLEAPVAAPGRAEVSRVVSQRVSAGDRLRVLPAGGPEDLSVAGPAAVPSRPFGRGRLSAGDGGVAVSLPGTAATTMPEQGGFVVELEQFSGPLDLLLHLIREDEVDITDLPISRIADQFLAVIADLGLNQAADYLEMAARLLRIKAQLLLPRRLGDDEWEDPRSELVRRLLEYQQIRELVDWLHHAAGQRADRLGRGF